MSYEVKTLLGIFTSFKKTTVIIFLFLAATAVFEVLENQTLTVFESVSYFTGMAVLVLAVKLLCAFGIFITYEKISYKGSLAMLIFVFFALMILGLFISIPALNALSEPN